LFKHPVQRWFGDAPTADVPYPDSWCARCNAEFLKVCEWTEDNSDCLDLTIICHRCYENSKASSVESLGGKDKKAWIEAVTAGYHALVEKQRALEADYGISHFERWDYDQSTGTLTFSDGGVARLVADIEFIGSVSATGGTWLWAWANFHNEAQVVSRIPAVRDHGEKNGFLHLTVPLWRGGETDGWELSGVAAKVLSAKGVYRVPTDDGFLYMALMSIDRVG
jgi:hypothetical protein